MCKREKTLLNMIWVILLSTLLNILPSCAYYEVPQTGRPRSAFSTCCCKKVAEDSQEKLYNCQYIETDTRTCPGDSRQYDVPAFGCPSELIFTRPTS